MAVVRARREEAQNEFEAGLRLPSRRIRGGDGIALTRASSIVFRAPQENFTIEDFEQERILGVGSFSKVVRVKKKDTGDVYALKVMDKDFITKQDKVQHVKRERIVLDQLNHPGIVQLLFTFQDANSLYMALESCEGGELFDQIARKGHFSEDEARFYMAEIIDAMEYLHGLGLIHQDIKPENLLLTADGHIKIADFGCVKLTESSQIMLPPPAANPHETSSLIEGTAAYVPPEALNTSPATIGNDFWALGCTLYQMLAGTSPFKDSSDWLTFERIRTRKVVFPGYFSDEAIDLIDKLLDTDPGRRLGAGPGGYPALKMHPFFKGIAWNKLRDVSAPTPKLILEPYPSQVFDGQKLTMPSNIALASTVHHAPQLASMDSFDSRWQELLEPGECIVLASKLKKLRLLTSKKVQLILTDRPRLFYVDPSKLIENMKILWSSNNPNDISIHVLNSSHFKVCTSMKTSSFEDKAQKAWQWKKAVESVVVHQ